MRARQGSPGNALAYHCTNFRGDSCLSMLTAHTSSSLRMVASQPSSTNTCWVFKHVQHDYTDARWPPRLLLEMRILQGVHEMHDADFGW